MADKEFKLDTSFTTRSGNYLKPFSIVLAIAGLAVIVLSMTTGLAARLLPMDDRYLSVLVPHAADGAEPISLQSLDQEVVDKTLQVHGAVGNRTEFSISGLQAVVELEDRFGMPFKTEAIPIDPAEIPAKGSSMFHGSISFPDQLSGYAIKFQIIDGPFVPHKDERTLLPAVISK